MFSETISLVLFLMTSTPALGEGNHQDAALVLCRNKETVRTIRVSDLQGGGCRTVYTKGGVDRVVGNGQFKESCETFLSNIKTNLEGADWKCKSVAKSKVSDFSPASQIEANE